MAEVRQQMGGTPLYISFAIDALDPAYAPGTGTPEIAGLTPSQTLQILRFLCVVLAVWNSLCRPGWLWRSSRGCQGLNVVGCDLVEVSPPYDLSGATQPS
ncbi:Agmatinase, mitochondrial [Apodemus speciosus]|uniref:Agmatinase, mitochondrial n=1 Tax=Apodemus speciosus TaxID=105296 RepID=A0ABQ0EQJ2_APOSI